MSGLMTAIVNGRLICLESKRAYSISKLYYFNYKTNQLINLISNLIDIHSISFPFYLGSAYWSTYLSLLYCCVRKQSLHIGIMEVNRFSYNIYLWIKKVWLALYPKVHPREPDGILLPWPNTILIMTQED